MEDLGRPDRGWFSIVLRYLVRYRRELIIDFSVFSATSSSRVDYPAAARLVITIFVL
jgi:hypothetical protein